MPPAPKGGGLKTFRSERTCGRHFSDVGKLIHVHHSLVKGSHLDRGTDYAGGTACPGWQKIKVDVYSNAILFVALPATWSIGCGGNNRQVSNIRRLSRQLNCLLLRCCWSIACRRCSNYIFILYLTPGFNRLDKDKCKTRRESFKFSDLVPLILEILRVYANESLILCSVSFQYFFNGSVVQISTKPQT